MLYTLFSPSEGKREGGETLPLDELLFGMGDRGEILEAYNSIVLSGNEAAHMKLFGIKKTEELQRFCTDIFTSPVMPALMRYDGVAYDYLDFPSLDDSAQAYLFKQCIVFSNLFGPIMGGDRIPDYKVKQGEPVGEIAPERYYAERFTPQLNALLEGHDILDLRAGYYDKFYKVSRPYTTLKFIKGGKVVSHWAKAYRGIVLREIAKAELQSIEGFMKLEIDGLMVEEIKKQKLKTEIVFSIVE